MIIKQIHIASFGPLVNFDAELYPGFNLIVGDNETGKTSLAAFIKFIFYGISGRSIDGRISERKKYVNFEHGCAEGYIVLRTDDRTYKIERSLYVTSRAGARESARESVTVTDVVSGERYPELERCPGEELFGVPEQVFVNTVFCGQANGVRIDGATTAAAVENLMFSADETVSVKKAAELLEKYRRSLKHKNGTGGEIASLREKEAYLKNKLDEASRASAEIIELEVQHAKCETAKTELEEKLADAEKTLALSRAKALARAGEEAENATAEAEAAGNELRRALSLCADVRDIDEGAALISQIDAEWAHAEELEENRRALESGASKLDQGEHPDPEKSLAEYRTAEKRKRRTTAIGTVFSVLAALFGVASGVMYYMKDQSFLAILAVAALMLVIGGVFFFIRSGAARKCNSVLDEYVAADGDELQAEIDEVLANTAEARAMRRDADSASALLAASRERAETLETRAAELADALATRLATELGGDNAKERLRFAISAARDRQKSADALRQEYNAATARADAYWEKLPKEDFAAAKALTESQKSLPSDEEAAAVSRESAFNRAKLESLKKKLHTIELELAAKRAASIAPSVVHDELSACSALLCELEVKHNAAVLAESTLSEAGENMRRGILPKIIKDASESFCRATEGRYDALGGGADFSINMTLDGRTHSGDHLSSGTEDMAYLCLRIALAKTVLGQSRPPLIFDEGLAFMDPGRTDAAIDVLSGSGYQVLLFSCREIDGTSPTIRLEKRDR